MPGYLKNGVVDSTSYLIFSDTGSTYSNGIAGYGGAVYCLHCTSITFTKCTFTLNQGLNGAAIFLDYDNGALSKYTETKLTLTSNVIMTNYAYFGGAFLSASETSYASL